MKTVNQDILMKLRMLQIEGDPDIFEELIGIFSKDMPQRIERISQAIKKKNLAVVNDEGHEIKASARILGALTLSDFGFELEHIKAINAVTQDLLLRITKEYESVQGELTQFLREKKHKSA